MPEMTYAEASRLALWEEMRRDPLVWALGEDLGPEGGLAGQYRGLQAEFGRDRIVDTPISESTIMGAAVGAAVAGTRPVAEMRFADFGLCAADELINQAAKIRYMFGGQARVPLVTRQSMGFRFGIAAQHSQSLEAFYAHVPGLVVVCPATPADNRGLLKAAIRCDDPVVYLEHKELWQQKGEVPEDGEAALVPLGVADVAREGDDVTVVTWSSGRHAALAAAEALAERGVAAEVIDLRTIWPWDRERVFASVRRTGRLVVAHEAVRVGGFGAEIAAEAQEALHGALRAPVVRIGGPRAPVPYAKPLEDACRLTAERVVEGVLRCVGKGGG